MASHDDLIKRIAQGLSTTHDAALVASIIRQRDECWKVLRLIAAHSDDGAAMLAERVLTRIGASGISRAL